MFNNDELQVMNDARTQMEEELANYNNAVSIIQEAEDKASRNVLTIEEHGLMIDAINKLSQQNIDTLKPFAQKVFDMLVKRLLKDADYSLNMADLDKAKDFILKYMETTSVYEDQITQINNKIIEKDNRIKEDIEKLLEEAKDSLKRKPIKDAKKLIENLINEDDREKYNTMIEDIIENYIKPKELKDKIERNFKKADNFIKEANVRGEFEPLIDAKNLLIENEALIKKVKDIDLKNEFNSKLLDFNIKLSNVENDINTPVVERVDHYYPRQLDKIFTAIRKELKNDPMNVDSLNELIKNAADFVKLIKDEDKRNSYITKLEKLIDDARKREKELGVSTTTSENDEDEVETIEEETQTSVKTPVVTDADREKSFYVLYKKAFHELDLDAISVAEKIIEDINNSELKEQLRNLLNFEKDYVNSKLNVINKGASEEEIIEEVEEKSSPKGSGDSEEPDASEEKATPVESEEKPVTPEVPEEKIEEKLDVQDDIYNNAKEKVEIAKKTRHPEDVNFATNAIEKLDDKDPRKEELYKDLAKVFEVSNTQEQSVEQQKQSKNDEELTAFEASLNRAKEIIANNGNITNGRVTELVRLAKELDSESLAKHVNDVNDIIMYYNMNKALDKQHSELMDYDTKVGLLEKFSAIAIASARKVVSKHKAKLIRTFKKAESANKTSKAKRIMNMILEADDITNSYVILTAKRIKADQALLQEIEEDIAIAITSKNENELAELNAEKHELEQQIQSEKEEFENAAYADLIEKVDDVSITKNPSRLKGIITTIALCLSYYPNSEKLNNLKQEIMYRVEKEESIDSLTKASFEYEFAQISKFYELFGDLYTSYNAMDFEDLSKSEDFKQYGIHSIR